jgi:uncharacterized integral membrane protein (TIGR00698 family)
MKKSDGQAPKAQRAELLDFASLDYLDSLEGVPSLDDKATSGFSLDRLKQLFPGMITAMLIALAAMFLAQHYLAPAVFFALLLGMSVNFLGTMDTTRSGLDVTAKQVLRLGIAISGAQLTLQEIAALGFDIVIAIILVVAIIFSSGVVLARLFKLPRELGVLAGGAVAICGASAALAISTVLPASQTRERHTIFVIVCVACLSTIAMIAYPIMAQNLGLSDAEAGLLLGGSIHDVAQVLGAGYAISTEAGEVATVSKLLRVALLFPVVMLIAFWVGARKLGAARSVPKLPGFLVAFIIVVGLNSVGLIAPFIAAFLADAARFFLVLAVAALGVKTSFGGLRDIGKAPLLLITAQSALMVGLMLLFILVFQPV